MKDMQTSTYKLRSNTTRFAIILKVVCTSILLVCMTVPSFINIGMTKRLITHPLAKESFSDFVRMPDSVLYPLPNEKQCLTTGNAVVIEADGLILEMT